MMEGRVRHALGLLAETNEANGYAAMDPELLDEMATFCCLFPWGDHGDFWTWHLARLSERIDERRLAESAVTNGRP